MRNIQKGENCASIGGEVEKSSATASGMLNRRDILKTASGALLSSTLGSGFAWAQSDPATIQGDVGAARKEGELLLVHEDQENEGQRLVKLFTEKTGVPAIQQHLVSGPAYAKLQAEARSGRNDIDVFSCADVNLANMMIKRDESLRYISPEMKAYSEQDLSNPVGYWSTYFLNTLPIMYNPARVDPKDAPKTWTDLLDPKWKGQIGFQTSGSGVSYNFWFLLKDVVPADFFTRLAEQRARGYQTSTQMVSDLQNGSLLIGGATSIGRWFQAQAKKIPMNIVLPAEGTPSNFEVTMIPKNTRRPNAAKLFVNYLLSKDGQTELAKIKEGVPSVRGDVQLAGSPIDLTKHKILKVKVKDYDTYGRPETRAEFVKIWRGITGV